MGGAALAAATAVAGMASTGAAADRRAEQPPPAVTQFSYSPAPLPLRHQNHCGIVNGNYVCADHCGAGYQVYYCPGSATGCCHAGYGYCDAGGYLRCAPPWFDFSSLILP